MIPPITADRTMIKGRLSVEKKVNQRSILFIFWYCANITNGLFYFISTCIVIMTKLTFAFKGDDE